MFYRRSVIKAVLTAGILALLFSQSILAQANSTPEERAHWIELTRKLEADPLDSQLNKYAEIAVKRLIEVKDIHVAICGAVFSDLGASKYKYSGQITRQYLLASAVFVIQNPDKAGDAALANLSAVQSVLKVYNAILQSKPKEHSKSLDELVKEQNAGSLESSIHKKCG